MLDLNKDGKISKDEIKEFLQRDNEFVSDKVFVDMISEIDKNGDGFIDFEEFTDCLQLK